LFYAFKKAYANCRIVSTIFCQVYKVTTMSEAIRAIHPCDSKSGCRHIDLTLLSHQRFHPFRSLEVPDCAFPDMSNWTIKV
ncbi:MAG: hypothetical protein Q4A15_02145, partial [Prevotellaceae bacterium]|nr:hypothetical protein [Prevotellaceae bacterium]